MPNVTPPTLTRIPGQFLGTPVRGTLKGALATLVLILLAMLFWLLIEQFRHTIQQERLSSINYSADLADNINLSMALRAETALNQLPSYAQPKDPHQLQELLTRLRQSLPALQSLALLSATGQVLLDSTGVSPDAAYLADLIKSTRLHKRTAGYYYGNNSDGTVAYLMLRHPGGTTNGYWLLRMNPDLLQDLARNTVNNRPRWLIENTQTGRTLSRSAPLLLRYRPSILRTSMTQYC